MRTARELEAWFRERPRLLDGGLATELERDGHDLRDPLWSARVLLERPAAVEAVHRRFLEAGAEVLTTASYQASFAALERRGLRHQEAVALLLRSVCVAQDARAKFLEASGGRETPLVAASVGPYGATLHDGSEYTGDYGLGARELAEFHAERFAVLATSGADLLACETVPCLAEVEALATLFRSTPTAVGWLSVSCRDTSHLRSGEPVAELAAVVEDVPGVVAIGVNCTDPEHLPALLQRLRSRSSKFLVAYPNSGEGWDAAERRWTGRICPTLDRAAGSWLDAGARAIGGCCRVGPEVLSRFRAALSGR